MRLQSNNKRNLQTASLVPGFLFCSFLGTIYLNIKEINIFFGSLQKERERELERRQTEERRVALRLRIVIKSKFSKHSKDQFLASYNNPAAAGKAAGKQHYNYYY